MRRFLRTDKKTWSLVDAEGHVLGSKIRPNWWSQRQELIVANGLFIVKGRSNWSSDLAVFFGDTPLLIAKFNWNSIAITSPHDPVPMITMRRKNFFSRDFQLIDVHGVVRASIKANINWSELNTEPELKEEQGEPLDPLLLLFATHAMSTQLMRAGAVVAAV